MALRNKNRKRAEKAFVLQHESTDCGAAALLSIVRYYGGESSIVHIREISGTSGSGTTMLGLCQAARNMGFEAQGVVADGVDELKEADYPCILNVQIENIFLHYVVCYGYENGQFLIGDPGCGIKEYTESELKEIWNGYCLLLQPTSSFELSDNIKKRKWNWIYSLIRDDLGLLISSLIIGVVTTVIGLSMTLFSQILVDDILPNKNLDKIIAGLSIVLIITLCGVLLSALRSKLILTQNRDFNNRVIRFFLSKLLHLPKLFFDTRKTGDIITRLNDTKRIQSVISYIISSVLIDVIILVVYVLFIFRYSVTIGLITLACSPVIYWIIAKHNKTIIAQQKDVMSSAALCESELINTVEGISDIKSYFRFPFFLEKNCLLNALRQEKGYELGNTNIKISIEAGLFSAIVNVGLIALCSYFVLTDKMTIGVLMAVISIFSTIFAKVSGMATLMIPINEARVIFSRMFEFVDTRENTDETMVSEQPAELEPESLSLDNISFRFIGRKNLFDGLSMEFKKGTITSIVGECGCGKSTLCQILERFYNPDKGRLLLNGNDASMIPLNEWSKMIAFVPQEIFLCNGTLLENICFGEKVESFEEVKDFCEKYGFDRFFRELPEGLFTVIGEGGVKLSGGQKQLVAFARALFRPHSIFILDEMTAAMDRKTESFINDLLIKMKEDHIIICVTHRLDTARQISDRIAVIENGVVAENGSHQELMQTDNYYSQYWKGLENII
ncbi:MAG: peptidase domain-containing ABC transporter [Bacteroidaceae bacterium]|nr:peptidase domain-containing ABC transporter [Bacteroidaceae bacterium]